MGNAEGKTFVSLPQQKMNKDGEESWISLAVPASKEAYKQIFDEAMRSWKEELSKSITSDLEFKIRLMLNNNENSKIKGYAELIMDGMAIKNIKVAESENGLFVAMPQYKTTDANGQDKWVDLVYPNNKMQRIAIEQRVLDEYNKIISSPEHSIEAENKKKPKCR